MRTALLVAVLVAVVFAEAPIRPMTKDVCQGDHYSWKDQSGLYAAGSNSAMCIFEDYEKVCTEIGGLVPCDSYDSICVQYNGDETWKAANAAAGGKYISNARPWKCVKEGYWYPDSGVLAVAQVIATITAILWGSIVVIMSCKGGVTVLAVIALILMLPAGIILAHSYYYLNAIVVIAGTLGAIGLFSEKAPVFGATGMIVGLVTLFWVTYNAGLGFVQHHSRQSAGTAAADTYENACNNYYRGYFQVTPVRLADDENPMILYGGYCGRGLLAGMLWVMIFLELLLVIVVASGAFSLGIPQNVEATEAPAAQTAAAPATTAPVA